MLRYFDFTIFLMSMGYLTWDILLTKGKISNYTVAMIVICAVEFILDHFEVSIYKIVQGERIYSNLKRNRS